MAKRLSGEGMRVACFNPRGRGGNPVATPLLYSVGYTEDLRRVIHHVQRSHPKVPLFAVGYSLGSNYLAKYVAEESGSHPGTGKSTCPLSGAVCVACPVDCIPMSNHLESDWLNKCFVDPQLVSYVKRVVTEHEEILSQSAGIDLEKAHLG